MAKWIITKYDGLEPVSSWSLPGGLDDTEIEEIMRRLVATELNPNEVISASLPKGDPERAGHFDRIGNQRPIAFGNNPHYMAVQERQ
ncbi:hypothetical protein HRR99_03235 [Agrobacterium vaccinii]|uniref:hypothetical protein n=1 Tax=Agrobacterium vaccinii TaxID=2735528 RepID=UPI001E5B9C45|nr:hypothetical protein [Agrobacterium vaccinii]UHS60601.1 hypothetical protein HRR99_03235 [Agrobacterium vaccinii]